MHNIDNVDMNIIYIYVDSFLYEMEEKNGIY